jgi:two-component system LytT family response regulator
MAYLFKAISIDDSVADAKRLRDILSHLETIEYVGNATTLTEGRTLLVNEHPDLLFLDIELPDGNGISAIHDLRRIITWPIKLVIYTVFDNQVLDALRNEAFDYLIKPIKREDLETLSARLVDDYERRADELDADQAASDAAHTHDELVMVNTIAGYVPILLTDIVYAEHVDKTKYWRIYLADGTSQMLRKGTSSTSILGMNRHFIQVNNRQIINLCYLGMLRKDACSLTAPYQEVEVPVTRSYLSALQDRMRFI